MLPYYRLANAVKHGLIEDIHDAIADGAPLVKPDITSLPLLELAQKHGQLEAARVLIDHGDNPSSFSSRKGDSLIHRAIREGQPVFVSLWITSGIDPTKLNDKGEAAIHLAARHGEQYVVSDLVAAGVPVSQLDSHCRTPIMYAAEAGQASTARHLLSLGANPLATDDLGQNAFDKAALNHHAACCKAMMENATLFPDEKRWLMVRLSDITKKYGYADVEAWLAAESKAGESCEELRTVKESAGRSSGYQLR